MEGWRKVWLGVLLGSLPGLSARAESPHFRGQVSALAADHSLSPLPDLTPWINLGASLRTSGGPRGWDAGADLSFHLGTQAAVVAPPGQYDSFPGVTDPCAKESAGDPLTVTPGLRDNGSRLFVRYRPWSWGDGEDLSLTLYPLSTGRLRLGWAYPATWGSGFGRFPVGSAGLQVQVVREGWSAFAAVKAPPPFWSRGLAPLVGAGLKLPLSFRAEVQAGQLLRRRLLATSRVEGSVVIGPNVGPPVEGPLVGPQGLSARLVHQVGEPIGPGVDFGLYGTAPELFEELAQPERSTAGFSSSFSLEATRLILTQPQGGDEQTVRTRGDMFALQARARWDRLRLRALALVRSPVAVALDDERLWSRLLEGRWKREAGVTVGADYHLPHLGLTPGAVLRVVRPAGVREIYSLKRSPSCGESVVDRWTVLTSQGYSMGSPGGEAPGPVVSGRGTLKWEPLHWVTAVGELSYTWDSSAGQTEPSRASLSPDGYGYNVPVPRPHGLGFHLLVQTRY